jgi:hypothetical protein
MVIAYDARRRYREDALTAPGLPDLHVSYDDHVHTVRNYMQYETGAINVRVLNTYYVS